MSTALKFEFDFDEVFEGIKLGVIKEMSEMSFNDITEKAVREIKSEMQKKISLTYNDEYELKNEIKKEIKDKVYQKLKGEIKGEYKKQYQDAFAKDITNVLDSAEQEVIDEIKSKVSTRLYNDLYSDISQKVKYRVENSISKMVDSITGNNVKIKNAGTEISKEEYESLVQRDRKLTALENGGVDNWEWYGEALSSLDDEDDE